ncbi:MAG: D-alanine--D-alanine ligase family protein [bacterium]
MSKLSVALLFGGRSQEHEISIMSARSVYSVLDKEKYTVIPFAISKKGHWIKPEKSLNILKDENINQVDINKKTLLTSSFKCFLEENIDLVLPVLHGPYGEDGRLQGLLEMLNITYIGSGVLGSAAGMDKAVMKDLFFCNDIPQGKYITINKFDLKNNFDELKKLIEQEISLPCFIKPANMGSSIGISKINELFELEEALQEAFKYDYKVVIEENISAREVECSVLGNIDIQTSLPGEIKSMSEFYDYKAKYEDDSTKLVIPANIPVKIIDEIRDLAVKAYKAIDCRGFARVDFFLTEENEILVNEINTIPGFTRYSMYTKMWEATGIKYSDLIDKIIELALEWHSL